MPTLKTPALKFIDRLHRWNPRQPTSHSIKQPFIYWLQQHFPDSAQCGLANKDNINDYYKCLFAIAYFEQFAELINDLYGDKQPASPQIIFLTAWINLKTYLRLTQPSNQNNQIALTLNESLTQASEFTYLFVASLILSYKIHNYASAMFKIKYYAKLFDLELERLEKTELALFLRLYENNFKYIHEFECLQLHEEIFTIRSFCASIKTETLKTIEQHCKRLEIENKVKAFNDYQKNQTLISEVKLKLKEMRLSPSRTPEPMQAQTHDDPTPPPLLSPELVSNSTSSPLSLTPPSSLSSIKSAISSASQLFSSASGKLSQLVKSSAAPWHQTPRVVFPRKPSTPLVFAKLKSKQQQKQALTPIVPSSTDSTKSPIQTQSKPKTSHSEHSHTSPEYSSTPAKHA